MLQFINTFDAQFQGVLLHIDECSHSKSIITSQIVTRIEAIGALTLELIATLFEILRAFLYTGGVVLSYSITKKGQLPTGEDLANSILRIRNLLFCSFFTLSLGIIFSPEQNIILHKGSNLITKRQQGEST